MVQVYTVLQANRARALLQGGGGSLVSDEATLKLMRDNRINQSCFMTSAAVEASKAARPAKEHGNLHRKEGHEQRDL